MTVDMLSRMTVDMLSRMTKKDRKRKEWILSQAENDSYCRSLIEDLKDDKEESRMTDTLDSRFRGNDKKENVIPHLMRNPESISSSVKRKKVNSGFPIDTFGNDKKKGNDGMGKNNKEKTLNDKKRRIDS